LNMLCAAVDFEEGFEYGDDFSAVPARAFFPAFGIVVVQQELCVIQVRRSKPNGSLEAQVVSSGCWWGRMREVWFAV
jgi:hypothetical protein